MPTIAVNGTQLFYTASGTSRLPLVLVHGSWGDHRNWDAVAPALAERFHVVRYDRRGHSHSPRPATQGSQLEDAMDLGALIEALDLAPAHVVGNSFGAATALRLACHRPELFRSLTAHEPPLFGILSDDPAMQEPLAAIGDRIRKVVELLSARDDERAARLFVETVAFGPGGWDMLPPEARDTFIANAPTFLDEQRDPDGMTLDLDALARFTRPVLLSRGGKSPPFFPAVVERIARVLPDAEQHLFAGAGHVPHATHGREYVEVVSGFIARVEGTAPHVTHTTSAEQR
jgi:pimeloyl-ACP methyl ester carboxylesterase